MTVPASVPAPPAPPASGAPAPVAPPAAGAPQPPPTPPTGAPVQTPQDGQQPPAGPPDPNSPENMAERLRRRQAVIDEQADQLRAWRTLGASPEAVQQLLAQQPPTPPAADPPVDVDALRTQIRGEVEVEVRTAADRRVVEADVAAALTGRVGISPQSALALMRQDLDGIRIGQSGHADPLDVEVAVRALLEREPGLASQAAPRFQTPADQGPRGGGEPKTLDQQIAEAKAAGNVRLALRLTNRKLNQPA